MSERDQLAGFHKTISEQLNARLEESPRFFWALVVVSTGYGYVLLNADKDKATGAAHSIFVATLASALLYFTVLWASWYLAALGYGFRFLQNSQHCIEHGLGWQEYTPKPGTPPDRGVWWLLPSIYIAHVFGLYVFLGLLFASFCWLWLGHTSALALGAVALVFGFAFIPLINQHYLDKFRKRRKSPEAILRLVDCPDNRSEGHAMSEALQAELKLSEEVITEIKRVLSAHKFSDDEWSTVVIGFIAQGIENHEALLLLLRSKLIGSGFALVRSVIEILVRGVWITTCATDAQVKKFRDQDKLDLTFGQMSDAIDKACRIEYFHDFKTRTWNTLNSYAHTGILQLGRRFSGDKLEPSYTDKEQIEVIRASTIAIVLLVRPFLMKHGHKVAAEEVDKLGYRLHPKK